MTLPSTALMPTYKYQQFTPSLLALQHTQQLAAMTDKRGAEPKAIQSRWDTEGKPFKELSNEANLAFRPIFGDESSEFVPFSMLTEREQEGEEEALARARGERLSG